MGGVRGYDLPTSDLIRGIVFENRPKSRTDFDVIIEFRGGPPQRINKLHQSYMSLQFPLLFVFGQSGFHLELQLKPCDGRGRGKAVTMNTYYKYQLYPRAKEFGILFRSGRGDHEGMVAGSKIMLPKIHDPVQDPKGYKLVMELMMHGPCGAANSDAPFRIMDRLANSGDVFFALARAQIEESISYFDG
ncbi:hypothetical protein Tco_1103422 [Tanacetum coccineum]